MKTAFRKLNADWNAEPNAPDPRIHVEGSTLVLSFQMNYMLWARFSQDDVGVLRFHDCWRYRLGSTNDEGWYMGQCRFSKLAPEWGEFYEVTGDLRLRELRDKWTQLAPISDGAHHYLFYLKDETFECDATRFDFEVIPHGARDMLPNFRWSGP
jgi:hypothetical protein